MGGQRWNECGVCGLDRHTVPLYERSYDRGDKSGRFVRIAWICDDDLEALRAGALKGIVSAGQALLRRTDR